jgi:hypothetical protein
VVKNSAVQAAFDEYAANQKHPEWYVKKMKRMELAKANRAQKKKEKGRNNKEKGDAKYKRGKDKKKARKNLKKK